MKGVRVLILVGLALGAACIVAGLTTRLFFGDELAARGQELEAARQEILDQTRLNVVLKAKTTSSRLSDKPLVSVVVEYQFVPPTADEERLRRVAEEAVRKHVTGAGEIAVTRRGAAP